MTLKVATALIILSLAAALTGCAGANSSNQDATDGNETATQQQAEPADKAETTDVQGDDANKDKADADKNATKPVVTEPRVATLLPEDDPNAQMVGEMWQVKRYESLDELAKALIAGESNIALVSCENAAALYNATNGSLMAVDAVMDDSGAPVAVTVVLNSFFKAVPDAVIEGMSQHEAKVNEHFGKGHYLRGSEMQTHLSDCIVKALTKDPSSVGGSLPPDNFYFLG